MTGAEAANKTNHKPSAHIAVHLRNCKEAVKFYQEMGVSLVTETPGAGVEMKHGPITLWVGGVKEPEVGRVFFEFFTDDLDQSLEFVKSRGCTLHEVTDSDDHRGRMVADPYGLRFHLYQAKKGN